jgi:hypothetical protein
LPCHAYVDFDLSPPTWIDVNTQRELRVHQEGLGEVLQEEVAEESKD